MAEILSFPVSYDEDCPQLTEEQLARLHPKYPENFKCKKTETRSVAEMTTV
jgi:hypothetical protein